MQQIGICGDDSVGAGVLRSEASPLGDGPQISKNGTFGASGTPPPTARQIGISRGYLWDLYHSMKTTTPEIAGGRMMI